MREDGATPLLSRALNPRHEKWPSPTSHFSFAHSMNPSSSGLWHTGHKSESCGGQRKLFRLLAPSCFGDV